MSNGWLGLNTALSGLRTSQEMLDIASHNIANASTPGYSRQRATLVAAPPFSYPAFNRSGLPGQLGTGVQITSIDRIRDIYLDQQINQQQAIDGYWTARADTLSTTEASFPEPSGSGMGDTLSAFWSAWEDLAADPSSSATRTAVLTQSATLAARFNRDAGQLSTQISGVDNQVRGTINDINDLASRIASLNKQIQGIVVSGDHANDLEDQRDQLVEQLNGLVPVQSVVQKDGTVTVLVGGTALVDHDTTRTVSATNDANGHALPTWPTGDPLDVTGGKLKAYIEARDVTLAGYQTSLNTLAKQIADQVNAATTSGVDQNGNAGLALFTYTPGEEAGTLAVNPAVGADPSMVVGGAAPRGRRATRRSPRRSRISRPLPPSGRAVRRPRTPTRRSSGRSAPIPSRQATCRATRIWWFSSSTTAVRRSAVFRSTRRRLTSSGSSRRIRPRRRSSRPSTRCWTPS
jgi:flagellar hook-associated protein 1 FlgK